MGHQQQKEEEERRLMQTGLCTQHVTHSRLSVFVSGDITLHSSTTDEVTNKINELKEKIRELDNLDSDSLAFDDSNRKTIRMLKRQIQDLEPEQSRSFKVSFEKTGKPTLHSLKDEKCKYDIVSAHFDKKTQKYFIHTNEKLFWMLKNEWRGFTDTIKLTDRIEQALDTPADRKRKRMAFLKDMEAILLPRKVRSAPANI